MKRNYLLPLLLTSMLLVGCGNRGETTPETPETVEYTLNFGDFQFEGNTKEISTGSAGGGNKFIEAMDNFVTSNTAEGLYRKIDAVPYVGLRKYDYPKTVFNALQFCSGTSDGSITFHFNKEVVSIEVTAQAYFKEYMKTYDLDGGEPYPVYSIDLDTTVKVGDETWTLPEAYYDEAKAEYHIPDKATRTFEVAEKSFTISDDENLGRFFVHSIKLTFQK